MANLSSDNLAAKQDEFASEQLKPVDALYAANKEQVDFDAAQRIKLISVDVRKRIQAEMGKDEGKSLFKRALGSKNIDRMDESGRRKAFKHAFEAVYGRFLFEDDKALDQADAEHLGRMLGDVLKFPIESKYGLKGRSELQAAVRRLAMVGGRKEVNVEGKDIARDQLVIDLEAKKTTLDANKTDIEQRGKNITLAKTSLDALRMPSDIASMIDAMTGRKVDMSRMKRAKNLLRKGLKKLRRIDFAKVDPTDDKGGKEVAKKIRDAISKFENKFNSDNFDGDDWLQFLNVDLKALVTSISELKLLEQKPTKKTPADVAQARTILQKDLRDLVGYVDGLKKEYATFSDMDVLKSGGDNLVSEIDEAKGYESENKNEISIRGRILHQFFENQRGVIVALPFGEAGKYLASLDGFLAIVPQDLTKENILNFVNTYYANFLAAAKDFFANEKQTVSSFAVSGDIMTAIDELSEAEGYHSNAVSRHADFVTNLNPQLRAEYDTLIARQAENEANIAKLPEVFEGIASLLDEDFVGRNDGTKGVSTLRLVDELAEKFRVNLSKPDRDTVDWNNFIESELKNLIKGLNALSLLKDAPVDSPLRTKVKELEQLREGFIASRGLADDIVEIEAEVNDGAAQESEVKGYAQANEAEAEKQVEKILNFFWILEPKITKFANERAALLSSSGADAVNEYLPKLDAFVHSNPNASEVRDFVENVHNKFLSSLNGFFDGKLQAISLPDDISGAISEISEFDEYRQNAQQRQSEYHGVIAQRTSYIGRVGGLKIKLEQTEESFIQKAKAIQGQMTAQLKKVNDFRTAQDLLLGDEQRTACDAYLDEVDKFIKLDVRAVTSEVVKTFMQDVHGPFLAKFGQYFSGLEGDNSKSLAETNKDIESASKELDMLSILENGPLGASYKKYIEGGKKKLAEVEAELLQAKAVKKPQAEIAELEEKIKSLKESAGASPAKWIIDQAFGGGKPPAEIKTLERKFRDAEKDRQDLVAVSEYFADRKTLSNIVNSGSSLATLIDESDLSKGAKEPLSKQINQLTQGIESKKSERSVLRIPTSDQLTKQLRAKQESMRGGSKEFDWDAESNKIIGDINTQRENLSKDIANDQGKLDRLNVVKEKCKTIKEQLATLVENLKAASKFGIDYPFAEVLDDGQLTFNFVEGGKATKLTVKDVEAKLRKIDLDSSSFDPTELTGLYSIFKGFLDDPSQVDGFLNNFDEQLAAKDKAVKTSKAALDKAKSGNAMLENLTDAQAAKKIIATLVAQQFPDMSLEDQYKMATAILAEDVATIQTTESYEKFAEKASADVLDTMQQAGFKGKLIGFKYKIGDKEEQPFKGLKPEDFANWPIMERHFKTGKFNHENGFFILAAMELFNGDVKSIQAVKTEKTLKSLIAKQLGVDERMDEAGISRIVDKAFDKQMEKVRPLVKSYFDHYDSNREEWESHSLRAMKLKLKALNQDRRTGKITEEVYAMKYEVLLKEAEASGVLDKLGLAQNTVLASFANSPFSQWFRDRGYDFKERAKKKAAGFAWSTTKVAASGLWGATKFTAKLATKPITIPLKLAAKLGVGFVNLFRANKWQPEILQKKTAAETKSLLEKTKEVASGVVGTYAGDWKARTHEAQKFGDRIKMGSDVLSSQADELAEKGKSTAVETTSPFIDLEEFKKQIAMIDAMKNAPASNDNKESKAA